MSGISGDLAELAALAQGLNQISQPGFMAQLAENFAQEALELTYQCFDAGTDPYGNAWPGLKAERGRNLKAKGGKASKPLRDTGTLRNSIGITSVSSSGFKLSTGCVYAAVHNFGHAFTPREQAAIRLGSGLIMFVRQGNWSYEMGRTKWRKVLQKATGRKWGRTAELPLTIDKVSRVFYVTVAPVIPRRQFLPSEGLPNSWRDAFRETYREAVKALLP